MNPHCMSQTVQCDSLSQGTVGVVMASGGVVMNGAAVTVVVAAEAGLAVGNR